MKTHPIPYVAVLFSLFVTLLVGSCTSQSVITASPTPTPTLQVLLAPKYTILPPEETLSETEKNIYESAEAQKSADHMLSWLNYWIQCDTPPLDPAIPMHWKPIFLSTDLGPTAMNAIESEGLLYAVPWSQVGRMDPPSSTCEGTLDPKYAPTQLTESVNQQISFEMVAWVRRDDKGQFEAFFNHESGQWDKDRPLSIGLYARIDLAVINSQNVNLIQPITVYGPGTYTNDYFWSPSQQLFVVGRDSGFEVFDIVKSQSLFEVGTSGKSKVLGFPSEDMILVANEKDLGTYLSIYRISSREFINTIGFNDLPGRPSLNSSGNQYYLSKDKKIAANNENAAVSIWDLATGEQTDLINTGANTWLFWLSHNGDKFATLDSDLRTVKLWSSNKSVLLSEIELEQGEYLTGESKSVQLKIWILQDANRIAAQSGSIVSVYNTQNGHRLSSFDIGAKAVLLDFAMGETVLGTVKDEQDSQFWNLENGSLLSTVGKGSDPEKNKDTIQANKLSADRTKLYTFNVSPDSSTNNNFDSIKVWNIIDGSEIAQFYIHPNSTFYGSNDGKYIVPFGYNWDSGQLFFGNLADGSTFGVDYIDRVYTNVLVSPDSKVVATYSYNKTGEGQLVTGFTMKIGKLETGELKKVTIPLDWQFLSNWVFSPDSSILAVSSFSNWSSEGSLNLCTGVAFWDIEGNLINNICFNDEVYDSVQFSTDSTQIMLYSYYPCYGEETEKPFKAFNLVSDVESENINDVSWTYTLLEGCLPAPLNYISSGGKYHFGLGDTWQLWESQTQKLVFDTKNKWLPALSSDGSVAFIIVTADDGWREFLSTLDTSNLSIQPMKPILYFDNYRKTLNQDYRPSAGNQIVMSPDGKTLATISRGTVTLWGVPVQEK